MADKKKASKKKAAPAPRAPKPKHVTIAAGQRLHVHVTGKNGKEIAEYIAGASPDGLVQMNPAPEAAAPVQDPDPNSGT